MGVRYGGRHMKVRCRRCGVARWLFDLRWPDDPKPDVCKCLSRAEMEKMREEYEQRRQNRIAEWLDKEAMR